MSTTSRYTPKALLRPRPKPLLIWMAPPVLALLALTSAAFAPLVVLAGGDPSINGQTISRAVYMTAVYPLVLIGTAVQLAAAYGLLTERLVARKLLTRWSAMLLAVSILILGSVTTAPFVDVLISTFWHWVIVGLCFWYFYGYERVRQYYAQLAKRRRTP